MNRPLCLLALLFCVCLQSCLPDKPGIYYNDQIPSGIKSTLHPLNDNLLEALKKNNQNDLEQMMSKGMLGKGYQRIRVTEKISNAMKDADYTLLADYYVVNKLKADGVDTIKERKMGDNNFNYIVNKADQYTYIAMFTSKSPQSKLITACYNKLEYGWKVTDLEVEAYRENGKTSPELLKYSKELLKKGYYVDAANVAAFAGNTLRPAGAFIFVKDQAIYDYCAKMNEIINGRYKLPLVVKNVATQPKIWRMTFERTKEGAFPNVNYISKINLLDTMALRKENELLGKQIGQVFKGIDKDKKYIFYTIYNETAKGVPYRDHYDLRQKF